MKLEMRGIEKSFGEKRVLRGLTFTAQGGSAFGLLGRNGAGKTTTLRILMNVFPSDGGEVLIDGKRIDYAKVGFGYLPEERGLYPKKLVFDQLCYFARLKGMSKADAGKAVNRWLERLGMSEYAGKRLDTLSKGNQQKIQLITAVAHDPDVIILDEPFSGLDPVNALLMEEVVREEIGSGRIVLFSSHQMNYIEEFCDRIAIINAGEIALQGELREIKRNYRRDRLTVRSEQADLIAAELKESCERAEDGALRVRLSAPEEKAAMMRRLTEKYDIDEIKVYEPSLNDIFVEYAGGRE